MEPVLHYDSEKALQLCWTRLLHPARPSPVQGFDQTLKGLLRDTDVWPPMYKVFTESESSASSQSQPPLALVFRVAVNLRAFEMGVKCQPRLWIRTSMSLRRESVWFEDMGNAGAISRASKMPKRASTSTCSSQFLSLRKAEDGFNNAMLAPW